MAFTCASLEIDKGQKIGIAGETGSGKSTLLRIIGGLEKPDGGDVFFENESVYPKLDRLIPGHPQMAYLSQAFELPKFISVNEFLDTAGLEQDQIDKVAAICRIGALLEKNTRELSGGERQRVALAKTILKQPDVLLLDEPFSNLDPHHERILKEVINDISNETGSTVLMVSHDPTDLLPWADQILVLRNGEIVQRGMSKDVYYKPKNEYIAGLFGNFQKLDSSKWSIIDNNAIVRPEQFMLNNHGKSGVVESVQFHGSHEVVSIKTDGEVIQALVPSGAYKKGDKVGVSLASTDYSK